MADNMDVDDVPRGTKRKADDTPTVITSRRIQALSQDVVNKIAAGEIIVAPVHALKELIENAVDAGSTSLEILIKGKICQTMRMFHLILVHRWWPQTTTNNGQWPWHTRE
jgi:hypothetical protein